MIFPDRRRVGTDPWLDWKIRVFFLGAVLALVGMARGSSLLVGLAIVVLVAGMAVGFLGKRDPLQGDGHETEESFDTGDAEGGAR